jgi:hypothetical protein
MKKQTMKRIPALIPLARDHGVGLVCAQYGRKAIRASVDDRLRLAEQMRAVCRDAINPNLEDEQWILSPVVGDESLRVEFHQRHRNIKALTAELAEVEMAQDPGLGLIARVANALDDYVRWEEHTLFPRIEMGMEDEQLRQVFKLTATLETTRSRPTQRLHRSVTLQQPSGLGPFCPADRE